MLSKKYLAITVIAVAAASVSLIPFMNVEGEDIPVDGISRIPYEAIMPVQVFAKPGQTLTIPIDLKSEKPASVDFSIYSEGKEQISRWDLMESKFDSGISATISKDRTTFDSENLSDSLNIVVDVSENIELGTYPLTLEMEQKISGGSNVVQQYLYIIVE